MSILVETAPRTIWLCVSDDEDDYDKPYPELYAEDAEITWSTDQPVAVTVAYVRADIAEADLAAARARIAELEALASEHFVAVRMRTERAERAEADLAAALALLQEASDDWVPHTSNLSAAIVDMLRRAGKGAT